jgi:flagellar biogenesis protein FliO
MKTRQKMLALICFTFGILPSAFAEATNSVTISQTLPDASVSLIRVMGSLALVIGLFLGGAWVFKNWSRLTQRQGNRPILSVLESRSLGARQGICVVGYEKQRFLIATSPAGISLLSHLPDAEPAEPDAAEKTSGPMPFAQALAEVLKKK